MSHSSKLHIPTVKRVGAYCDALLSAVSPVFFAILVGTAGVWAFEEAPSQTYIQMNQVIPVQPGQALNLKPPFVAQIQAHQAVYHTWLEDINGDRVYQFPDHDLVNPKVIDLTELKSLTIPKSLKPGTYILQVEALYPFNPFKNGRIWMTVATVIVLPPTQ